MATKEKRKGLLSGGLFDKPFMDSRATTHSVSTKEWVLGHLIGPLGLIFVVNTIAALVEKFFTQQTGAMYGAGNVEMIMKMGGWYEIIMTAAKVLAVGIGLLNGWLIQKTESRQGRMRPWHLIFGFVSIIIGCLIFLFPGNHMGNIYWFYFFFPFDNVVFEKVIANIVDSYHRHPRKIRLIYFTAMDYTFIEDTGIFRLVNQLTVDSRQRVVGIFESI